MHQTQMHTVRVLSQREKYAQHLQLDQRSPLFIQMFVVSLASAVCRGFAAPTQSFFKPIYCIVLGLCGDFLTVSLKRDQFL